MEVLIFGLNKLKFYSDLRRSGDSYHPDKLIINSTPYNIVFTKQSGVEKSVLLLPPLKPFLYFIEMNTPGSVNIDIKNVALSDIEPLLVKFTKILRHISNSLEPGCYRILRRPKV